MSTYVMSDIHGCYEDMQKMLSLVDFSESDILILAGDYIDRGPNSFEMLNLITNHPDNMIMLCGNHDLEFAYNVDLIAGFAKKNGVDSISNEAARLIYSLIQQITSQTGGGASVFDYYGTIGELIEKHKVNIEQLMKWASGIRAMEYTYNIEIQGKKYIIVHAGYAESLDSEDMEGSYDSIESFYIYSRDDAYINGGIPHGTVIAGHTPTIAEEELPYNNGSVFKMYDEDLDCTFYDIDCGCSYRSVRAEAKLACIRLEDEKIFYA